MVQGVRVKDITPIYSKLGTGIITDARPSSDEDVVQVEYVVSDPYAKEGCSKKTHQRHKKYLWIRPGMTDTAFQVIKLLPNFARSLLRFMLCNGNADATSEGSIESTQALIDEDTLPLSDNATEVPEFAIADEVDLYVDNLYCGSGHVDALDKMNGNKIPEGMVGIVLYAAEAGAEYLKIHKGTITWDDVVCHARNSMIEELEGRRFAACKTLLAKSSSLGYESFRFDLRKSVLHAANRRPSSSSIMLFLA